eukprot:6214488-Pleurochrysis_carterae.AAC.2
MIGLKCEKKAGFSFRLLEMRSRFGRSESLEREKRAKLSGGAPSPCMRLICQLAANSSNTSCSGYMEPMEPGGFAILTTPLT